MKIIAAIALLACVSFGNESNAASSHTVPVVYSENICLEVDVPPKFLWGEIKRMYVDGDKFKRMGFSISPIRNDPTAYLDGIKLSKTENGVSEQREARFTVIDDKQYFLALTAKYSGGTTVFASYQVRRARKGSEFQLIFHSSMEMPVDAGVVPSPTYVRGKLKAFAASSHRDLIASWAAERVRIEAMARATKTR